MTEDWISQLPELDDFSQVTDTSRYVPLPDDWCVGVSDVVASTKEIQSGRYKAVNLAGAGTISAVANALDGDLHLFIFGGDGARFAVPPEYAERAADALSRVAMWARRDLDLQLRVATISIGDIRSAGFDVKAVFWRVSEHVRYAMFLGGGLEWAESQLKSAAIGLEPAGVDQEPDLTGLSCQWGAIRSRKGKILSLIVKPDPEAMPGEFEEIVSAVIALLETNSDINPMPADGPDVRWPATQIGLQSRIARQGRPAWLRWLSATTGATLVWLLFKAGRPVFGFDPSRYRREMAENTDFRKFDDGLMLTVDCDPDVAAELRRILSAGAARRIVRFGIHEQDEALITCVAPSAYASDHIHFVDGGHGGYARAAAQLRSSA